MLALSSILPAPGQIIDDLLQVKSPFDEQHPVMSPSGELYFTIAFHPENRHGEEDLGDVWLSTSSDNMDFQKPSPVMDLSTSGYDVVVGFLDPNSILVYHDGGERMQGIHQYSGSGKSWKHEKQLKVGSFKNYSKLFGGRLSPSGDVLILSLEAFGSYGNEDIYVSFLKEGDSWTSPQNLGPQINTFQQEVTPSLAYDNRLLFFSSNGYGSIGGSDIYFSERLDDTWENWSIPKPLSSENSKGVELSYFQLSDNATKAIFTTTQNSEGYGDILMVRSAKIARIDKQDFEEDRSPGPEAVMKGKVEEPESAPSALAKDKNIAVQETQLGPKETEREKPVSPENLKMKEKVREGVFPPNIEEENQSIPIKALDSHTFKEIDFEVDFSGYSGGESNKMSSAAYQNNFPIDLDSVKNIKITAVGYLPLTLMVDQLIHLKEPLMLTPASKGSSMVLEQVLFQKGTAEILDDNSMEFISSLADFLKANPTVKVLLAGHTDNMGNAQLNKKLSLERASAIRTYLVDKGVDFERIRIAGWGGMKPISSNKTEEGRILNRRVEMVISDR
jgi:outer membrane protein OmpA-like peptidoglycan-associated protein